MRCAYCLLLRVRFIVLDYEELVSRGFRQNCLNNPLCFEFAICSCDRELGFRTSQREGGRAILLTHVGGLTRDSFSLSHGQKQLWEETDIKGPCRANPRSKSTLQKV